jgi:hypothetical protein
LTREQGIQSDRVMVLGAAHENPSGGACAAQRAPILGERDAENLTYLCDSVRTTGGECWMTDVTQDGRIDPRLTVIERGWSAAAVGDFEAQKFAVELGVPGCGQGVFEQALLQSSFDDVG